MCTVSYKCPNYSYSATPFAASSASYVPATGRLCYAVSARAPCTKCTSKSCAATTGELHTCIHVYTLPCLVRRLT